MDARDNKTSDMQVKFSGCMASQLERFTSKDKIRWLRMINKIQYEKWLKDFEAKIREIKDGEPSDASGFTDDILIDLINE